MTSRPSSSGQQKHSQVSRAEGGSLLNATGLLMTMLVWSSSRPLPEGTHEPHPCHRPSHRVHRRPARPGSMGCTWDAGRPVRRLQRNVDVGLGPGSCMLWCHVQMRPWPSSTCADHRAPQARRDPGRDRPARAWSSHHDCAVPATGRTTHEPDASRGCRDAYPRRPSAPAWPTSGNINIVNGWGASNASTDTYLTPLVGVITGIAIQPGPATRTHQLARKPRKRTAGRHHRRSEPC